MTTTDSPDVDVDGTGSPQAQVARVLERYAEAYRRRDAAAVLAFFSDGAVRYDLAPPLRQAPGTMVGDVAGLAAWFAGFDGPVLLGHEDLEVTADGDIAFAHALTRMTATPAGSGHPFSFWLRSTFGLRRLGGAWRITHEHRSTPFHMDGSFRAATDLQP